MTDGDERTGGRAGKPGEGEREHDREAPGAGEAAEREGRSPPGPTPEEAPELLGDRSDYPIAWEPEDGGDS